MVNFFNAIFSSDFIKIQLVCVHICPVTKSCPALLQPHGLCSLPGSSVHGISQVTTQPSDSGSGAKGGGRLREPEGGRPSTKGVGPIPSLHQTTPPTLKPPGLSHPPPPTTSTSAPPGPSQYLEGPRRAVLPSLSSLSRHPPPVLGQLHTSRRQRRSRPLKPQRRHGYPLPSLDPGAERRERYYLLPHQRCPWPRGAAALDPGRRFSARLFRFLQNRKILQ